jgi:hypothetical protein
MALLLGQSAPHHGSDAPAHLGLRGGAPAQPMIGFAGTGTPLERTTLPVSPLLAVWRVPTTAAPRVQSPPPCHDTAATRPCSQMC